MRLRREYAKRNHVAKLGARLSSSSFLNSVPVTRAGSIRTKYLRQTTRRGPSLHRLKEERSFFHGSTRFCRERINERTTLRLSLFARVPIQGQRCLLLLLVPLPPAPAVVAGAHSPEAPGAVSLVETHTRRQSFIRVNVSENIFIYNEEYMSKLEFPASYYKLPLSE